ncbi:MAG: RsmE family RNA methyltransferase, partial [Rhodospirillaceae bacterium]
RLLFAPVKKTGTDFIVEKATELGAARLTPVVTDFTDAGRANAERLRARAVEAAEQCGRLDVPTVDDAVALTEALAGWPADTPLIVADETGGGSPVLDALGRLAADATPAFVIGPQGGFSETELAFLRGLPFSTSVDLGPRVLRAETAATAALTCWQALRGDWTPPPGAT